MDKLKRNTWLVRAAAVAIFLLGFAAGALAPAAYRAWVRERAEESAREQADLDSIGLMRAGYLGALYGYLPTPRQIGEGGYEVTGFQRLFGLSGNFDAGKIAPTVIACAKRALDDL